MPWNKEKIQKLIDGRDEAVCRALVAIKKNQTDSEIYCHSTHVSNGIGFNQFDAKFLTAMAELVEKNRPLSKRQIEASRKKIRKYWKQLAYIANQKESKENVEQFKKMEEACSSET